jgi:uncharacterized phage protein gp47/JayE
MVIPDFEAPSFLNDQDAETIHERMMDELPPDIDDTEGGFPWDFTKPTALEKAEMLEFHLTETLKIMFPQWAYDTWLDLHAKGNGLERKPANPASGNLIINGISGTTIPAGFKFAVPAIGDAPAIEYQTVEKYTIGEEGTVTVTVTAIEPGMIGNVPAGAVSLMVTPMKGITAITNPEQISGGAEAESDDELRRRIDEMDATSEASFVGSNGDYKRWAEEVSGVGTALVMPEWAGPGTVKVVVIDANGQPANESIITAVYNYIMSPDDRLQRKAPVGATVTVEAPAAKTIDYVFVLELEAGETQETVIERFVANLQAYYIEAKKEEVVRYTRIGSILTSTSGVKDYAGLTINAGTANITLSEDEYPITGTIDPTGGGGTS